MFWEKERGRPMKKNHSLIKKIIRIFLVGIALLVFLWFFAPVITGRILNIGNSTGMAVSSILFFYGILMPQIHVLTGRLAAKKAGRIILVVAAFCFAAVILLAGIETGCMVYAAGKAPDENATLVVLGCRTYGDRPSVMLETRLRAAYDYLIENPTAVCVVSGGQGADEPISEGEFMYQYLIRKGIAPERIYREIQSTSTRENLVFSQEVMKENGLHTEIAIVTNEYHEYRAFMVADSLEMECSAVPARTPWWLFPTYYFRELYGIMYEWVL